MRWGRRTGAEQVPWWFVEAYYRAQASAHDVPAGAEEAHAHFLAVGRAAGLAPNPVHDVVGSIAPVDDDELGLLPVRPLVDVEGWLATHPSLKHRELVRSVLEAARADPGLAVFRSPRGTRTSWQALLDRAASLADDAQVVRAAGAFDAELYNASTGVRFASFDAALWHYLEVGAAEGLSPHAAFHPVLGGSPPDPRALVRALSRAGAGGPGPDLLVPLGPDGTVDGPAVTRQRVLDAVRAVATAAPERRSAAALLAHAPAPQDGPRPALLVLVTADDLSRRSTQGVRTLQRQDHTAWRLVVLLDRHTTPWRRGLARELGSVDGRVEVVATDHAVAWPHAVVAQHPDHAVLVWDGSTRYRPDALARLLDHLPADGAARGWVAGDVRTLTGLTLAAPAGSSRALAGAPPVLSASVLAPGLAARAPQARLDCAAWTLLLQAAGRDVLEVAPLLAGRGTRTSNPPDADADAVRLAATAAAAEEAADTRSSTTADVSLLVTASITNPAVTAEVVRAAVADGQVDEVVLATDDPLPAVEALVALLADLRRVLVVATNGAGYGARLTDALAASTGDVVVLAPDALPATSTWPRRCLAALEKGVDVAVPVALTRTGTIRTAGLVFDEATGAAHPLLEGHPGDDAHLVDGVAVHGAASAGIAARRDSMRPTSLSMRPDAVAAALAGAHVVAVSETVVDDEPADVAYRVPPGRRTHDPIDVVLARAGWARAGTTSRAGPGWRPLLTRRAVLTDRPTRWRWALKNPAPGAPFGDRWGDTFFLDSLAGALRRLGQDVVIDRAEAHRRPGSDQLDDVTLTLRGLAPYVPTPGATHVLWVISHPDEIPDAELRAVDLAYGASRPWAEEATRRSGRPVRPLLQATDTTRFHPDVEPALDVGADRVLFVGNHRDGGRPVVQDLVTIGAALHIHGANWERNPAARYVASTFVPNELLPRYYRAARLVANDHWPDMAARGFVSNRAFDAAATGALVVSDPVAGGFPDLHGLVRAYTSREELADLVSGPGWMGRDERDEAARRVVDEHSFDARAATLLDDVAAHRLRSR